VPAMTGRCADVHAFADGELADDEVVSFLEHLCDCPRCYTELDAVLALRALAETMDD
jgi:anti-sigma factor RsiW